MNPIQDYIQGVKDISYTSMSDILKRDAIQGLKDIACNLADAQVKEKE
jgi:hypothetical protein